MRYALALIAAALCSGCFEDPDTVEGTTNATSVAGTGTETGVTSGSSGERPMETGGSGASDAGTDGADGTSTSGAPSEDSSGGAGDGPPYAECDGDTDCVGVPNEICGSGNTCVAPCRVAQDCPDAPPSGDVSPFCDALGRCRLGCPGPGDDCPDGMSCVGLAAAAVCIWGPA